ncbi:MAG: lipocalin family protein [Prevotella sp.]|nr:lipocalin family protein [Prevotella sp.]MDD5895494.1 lipocalin family protein [Prevotellaceae bacterium]
MKKILLMAFAAVMFTQCGNKTAQNQAPAEEEDTISVVENEVMVFGICGEGSAMNTLEVITDTGDTLNLSLEKAKEEGHVYGGYSVGDRIAVYLQKKDNEPLVVINETTLMGNWLMPNPIDGSSTLGMSIKDGGIAESINQPTIIFKTWKIVNGQLEITLVREGGGDEEETNSYSMEKLDADSLIFYGPEDRFEYGREKRNDIKK